MEIRHDQFGWQVWKDEVVVMNEPHQHSEIELNFIARGAIYYLLNGRKVWLKAGNWMVFWGALPHRLVEAELRAECLWVTLPLSDFLRFNLPESLTRPVLHGERAGDDDGRDPELFGRWLEDWQTGTQAHRRIVALELEARLRRLALKLESGSTTRYRAAKGRDKAAQMARFVSEHYGEAIGLPEVAGAAGLHPNYASGLFKASFGMTVLEYLTQHRLAHAQRLLATTDRPVLEIAFGAGFGSSSRFYAAFEAKVGLSPLAYRKSLLQ